MERGFNWNNKIKGRLWGWVQFFLKKICKKLKCFQNYIYCYIKILNF